MGGKRAADLLGRRVAALAGRQHGVVSRRQLLDLGLGADAIDGRIRRGLLHVLHRGVYAVGHEAVGGKGRWMAAVLACGEGAVLSHRSAAALWGIHMTSRRGVEVTVPGRRRKRKGIDARESRVPPDERTEIAGIPVTGLHRTLLDLAAVAPERHVERAMAEAEHQSLTDQLPLQALLRRYPRRRGRAKITRILARGAKRTRSDLEARFLAAVRRAGLPEPEANATVAGYEVDLLWRAHRLVVEIDSRTFHMTTAAFERDRAKDRALQRAGLRVLRLTEEQWVSGLDDVRALVADIGSTLGRS